jgi:hypothetical protein
MNPNRKHLKIASYILTTFGVVTLAGIISAHTPYVPFNYLENLVFILASVAIFFVFILTFSFYSGSSSDPAGFRLLRLLWENNEYKKVAQFFLCLPLCSMMLGYFIYFLIATLPSYPTKLLTNNIQITNAICIRNGSDRYRGGWSEFKTTDGMNWKVAGYGKLCQPEAPKTCSVAFSEGALGYFIRSIQCS